MIANQPERDPADQEGDLDDTGGFDACEQDVLPRGPIACVADPVQAVEETVIFGA